MTDALDIGDLPPADRAAQPGSGLTRLSEEGADALLAVPGGGSGPTPLLVFLHGSGGDPQQSIALVGRAAARRGVAVLAPRSAQHTWDVVLGRPGPDVGNLRRLLTATARHVDIDPTAVAFGGFSDGASCALTLGLGNPRTVAAVLAFSPGFFTGGRVHPLPRCFVSHGTGDRVLPIGRTSHRIVPLLRAAGHEVEYLEFTGGHEVPRAAVEHALTWWLGGRRPGA